MRTAGGSQRAAWGASVQRWMQDAPTAAAGRAEGAAPPVAARSYSGAHLEAPPRQGGGPVLPPLAPGQPPGAHSWRGPPAGPHPRGVRPPSPGEQDCAVLQRVAAHRPPALPDQLGFRALHTRSGTREARLGPSGCGHRHCTCRAISGVTRTTWHPLRFLHLGWARSSHLYFPALGRGAPALLAPLWRF